MNDMIKEPLLAPSLLAADFLHLNKAVKLIDESEADWLHMDVMDGRFVPNISFGMMVVEQVGKVLEKPMDVHLMIEEPEKYVTQFAKAGADTITVHYEACPHLHRNIQQIKDLGVKAGVAINPHTPVALLEPVIEDLDLVLVMSVNPGFGGQKFIFETLYKIRQLRQIMQDRNAKALIEVDGGVGLQNAAKIMEAGADVLVAGSSVFGSEDPMETIKKLKSLGNLPVYEV
ncbi:ribulose-phosphate 3-epimerase [Membranihabitans marinus]|nr:ribulose-phosphate 3-epimerase [Membranihabitans marinus]